LEVDKLVFYVLIMPKQLRPFFIPQAKNLPPSWSNQKSSLETFLQVGASKKIHWKPSSKLEGAKKFAGNLPPS